MTSSARDARYGRRGGGWAETHVDATCATCRNGTAKWLARLDPTIGAVQGHEADGWLVCNRCKEQAERLTTRVIHEALDA